MRLEILEIVYKSNPDLSRQDIVQVMLSTVKPMFKPSISSQKPTKRTLFDSPDALDHYQNQPWKREKVETVSILSWCTFQIKVGLAFRRTR